MAKPVEKLDALQTLGTILAEGHKRDAIHVAVVPGTAAEELRPGQHVGYVVARDGDMGTCSDPVGIVDPFIQHTVLPRQRFWVFVYPRTITSLRHVWTHPAFDDEAVSEAGGSSQEKKASMAWIEDYASGLDSTAEEFIERAKHFLATGDNWCRGDIFEGESLNSDFWDHYENVTGERVRQSNRESFFSCSC